MEKNDTGFLSMAWRSPAKPALLLSLLGYLFLRRRPKRITSLLSPATRCPSMSTRHRRLAAERRSRHIPMHGPNLTYLSQLRNRGPNNPRQPGFPPVLTSLASPVPTSLASLVLHPWNPVGAPTLSRTRKHRLFNVPCPPLLLCHTKKTRRPLAVTTPLPYRRTSLLQLYRCRGQCPRTSIAAEFLRRSPQFKHSLRRSPPRPHGVMPKTWQTLPPIHSPTVRLDLEPTVWPLVTSRHHPPGPLPIVHPARRRLTLSWRTSMQRRVKLGRRHREHVWLNRLSLSPMTTPSASDSSLLLPLLVELLPPTPQLPLGLSALSLGHPRLSTSSTPSLQTPTL